MARTWRPLCRACATCAFAPKEAQYKLLRLIRRTAAQGAACPPNAPSLQRAGGEVNAGRTRRLPRASHHGCGASWARARLFRRAAPTYAAPLTTCLPPAFNRHGRPTDVPAALLPYRRHLRKGLFFACVGIPSDSSRDSRGGRETMLPFKHFEIRKGHGRTGLLVRRNSFSENTASYTPASFLPPPPPILRLCPSHLPPLPLPLSHSCLCISSKLRSWQIL